MQINVGELYQAFSRVRNAQVEMPLTTLSHSVVIPYSTYSPWLDNHAFMKAYQLAEENTLVDIYRCYELWNLVGQLGAVKGDILEVGVWRGGTGCLMAKRAQMDQLDHGKKVVLCDTFAGVVKAGAKDTQYQGGEHSDTEDQYGC